MNHKLCFAAVLTAMAGSVFAADTLKVNTKIDQVMVYSNGAMVQRSGTLNLPKGTSIVAVEGLSRQLNASTLQALVADPSVTIASVTSDFVMRDHPDLKPQADRLDAKLKKLADSLTLNQADLDVLAAERELILANKNVGGNQGSTVASLQSMAQYFVRELAAIGRQQLALQNQRQGMLERQKLLNEQRKALGNIRQRCGRVLLTLEAASARPTVPLRLSYLASGAWWSPSYELRVQDTDTPLHLVYNAGVYQNTGEDWKQVRLVLSTGDPSRDYTIPQYQVLTVSKPQPKPLMRGLAMGVKVSNAKMAAYAVDEETADMDVAYAASAPVPVSVESGAMATEFAIAMPYTIPSDGKKYQVEIQQNDLPADYQYVVMPRQSKEVWLSARVPDYTSYNLLSGPASLFIGQVYQGEVALDAASITDTLQLSVGRDKDLLVKREEVKNYTVRKTVGGTVKVQKAYDITLRNNKKQTVKLQVVDQYPVSSDSEIKVELTEASGAKVQATIGKLTWEVTLAPGESRTLRLAYEVKYPKEFGYIAVE